MMFTKILTFIIRPFVAAHAKAKHQEAGKGALLYVEDVEMLHDTIRDIIKARFATELADFNGRANECIDLQIREALDEQKEWTMETLDKRLMPLSERFDKESGGES